MSEATLSHHKAVAGRAPGPLVLAAALLFAALMVTLAWVGFHESDDGLYAGAARAWAENGYFIGGSHWGLRHLIVLPMAGLFALFGRSEWTLVAPVFLYTVGLAALAFWIARRAADSLAGLLAAVLLISIPMIAAAASTVTTDVPEALFVIGSVWCFHLSLRRASRAGYLLAGLLAGMAVITRETTIALIVFYGILFLAGYGRDRWAYVWIGVGFTLVAGLDTLFLYLGSGDPLHRLHVTMLGVEGDNPTRTDLRPSDGIFNAFGVIDAPRWIQGPLMLVTSQLIGPVVLFALPATLAVVLARQDTERRRIARLLGLLALTWFVMLNYVLQSLWVLPRYNIVPIAVMVICLGIKLSEFAGLGRRVLSGLVLAAILLPNLMLTVIGGRDPIFGEQAYAEATRLHPEVIRTDPSTRSSATWLLEVDGTEDRAKAEAPAPGGLYFFNAEPRRKLPADWPVRAPQSGWPVVQEFVEAPRLTTYLVTWLGLDTSLPRQVVAKLAPTPRRAILYRVPPG